MTGDKTAVAYRYPADVPLRFELRWHNFSEQTQRGSWRLELPPDWRLESAAAPHGRIALAPLSDTNLVVRLLSPAGVSAARRDRLRLNWRGNDGATDRGVLQLAAEGPAAGPAQSFTNDWRTLDAETMRWDRTTTTNGVRLTLTQLAPGVTSGLLLPLRGLTSLRPDDVIRFRARLVESARFIYIRTELITPQQEAFRHGEDQALTSDWHAFECRAGDFTPAFWSHLADGNPSAARYLRLDLFSLKAQQAVELTAVELIRSR